MRNKESLRLFVQVSIQDLILLISFLSALLSEKYISNVKDKHDFVKNLKRSMIFLFEIELTQAT